MHSLQAAIWTSVMDILGGLGSPGETLPLVALGGAGQRRTLWRTGLAAIRPRDPGPRCKVRWGVHYCWSRVEVLPSHRPPAALTSTQGVHWNLHSLKKLAHSRLGNLEHSNLVYP